MSQISNETAHSSNCRILPLSHISNETAHSSNGFLGVLEGKLLEDCACTVWVWVGVWERACMLRRAVTTLAAASSVIYSQRGHFALILRLVRNFLFVNCVFFLDLFQCDSVHSSVSLIPCDFLRYVLIKKLIINNCCL